MNLPALREIGFSANRRLLRVQRLDHDPIAGTTALHEITEPVITDTGTRVPGLRLAQQRSQALLTTLPIFRLQPAGFRNAELRPLIAELRGLPPDAITAGQITYDLRRLRVHGFIERIPHTHRYHVTDHGLHNALLLTRINDRLLPEALADIHNTAPTSRPLRAAAHTYQRELDNIAAKIGITV